MSGDVIEVYQDSAGKWRWREVAANGTIVADSGQGYSTRSNAFRAARRRIAVSGHASVVRV